jgi:Ribonuclease G/E
MVRPDRPTRDGRYIVSCPACEGTGRIRHVDSVVPSGCRLCWERGVCARIVADRYRRRTADGAEGTED